MMKKYILSSLMLLSALAANAVPAKPGQWRKISLADGTSVRVLLAGDEFMKYYVAEDGTRYVPESAESSIYVPLVEDGLSTKRRKAMAKRRMAKRKIGTVDQSIYRGKKKGLVILVNFQDVKFQDSHDLSLYKDVLNAEHYKENGCVGSVKDYFRDQSNGAFELDFDVVGPCTLSKNMSYYGKNDSNGDDIHPGEMVAEACLWAHEHGVNFADYDWNGDGNVNQVFVLYAGLGEADGGSESSVWPHMFALSEGDYGKTLSLDGVTVDTYACSSELNGDSEFCGIGTFCHEFSHCMGFPDLYDTDYKGWYGMGFFDLMCSGSYNGNGFVPAGYSAYEKNECGWITLHDVTNITEAQKVEGLKPISEYGDAYILKNKAHEDEYYIVENRQQTGWDAGLEGAGVMVTYVDYDPDIWYYNVPNTKNGEYYDDQDHVYQNDHQRLTIFHADNSASIYSEDTDLYPYGSNNTLSKTSFPAATLHHQNADGSEYMHISINDMAIAADGTASLTFVPNASEPGSGDDPVIPSGSMLFYESFNGCEGEGGNDGKWNDFSSTYDVVSDNAGWASSNNQLYGASQCVKVGSSKKAGTVTTPAFTAKGKAVVTFKAGAWDASKDATSLTLTASNGTLADSKVTIAKGAWTNCTTQLNANGAVKLTFATSAGRFFLDEVRVTDNTTDGIEEISAGWGKTDGVAYYTLDGRRLEHPQTGINIVKYADGTTRKVIK